MLKIQKLLIFSFFVFTINSFSQESIVIPPQNIKSIVFKPHEVNAYTPIIKLGKSFTLAFDDLNGNRDIYSYKIEHYDYNWNKSNIIPSEFINGFPSDRIREFENSFNTLVDYTHYSVQIPNRNTSIKISGNYMISVLDNTNNVVFSRKFIVYEDKIDVQVSVHRSRDINYIDQKHDLQFTINHQNLQLRDPNREINVSIYKNMEWNSVIKNIRPKYIRGSQLLYNYVSELSFWAGNEFLYFDTKQIRNATNNIAQTKLLDIFNTYLYVDEERYNKAYSFYPDVNGNFVLRTLDTDDVNIEGDYSLVHFKLETGVNLNNKDVYVYGAFNNWQLTEENRMKYNSQSRLYEASILFKQGFFGYTYITANQEVIDKNIIEGSYYQTENEYTVIVYYKQFGNRYDQVIGIGKANSQQLQN